MMKMLAKMKYVLVVTVSNAIGMIRTIENVQSHCHIKQRVMDSVLYRMAKISEIKVRGTEFQPRQYQEA